MNCYMCLHAGVSTSAVAVCRSCGAACCFNHLKERTHAGRGPGMQPMLAPQVEILCERCMMLQSALFTSGRRKGVNSASISTTFKPSATRTLPDAKEAVKTVEELLGLEHAGRLDSFRRGWRRFFERKRSA